MKTVRILELCAERFPIKVDWKQKLSFFNVDGATQEHQWQSYVTTNCGIQKGLQLKYKQLTGYVLLLKRVLVKQTADKSKKQKSSHASVINTILNPNTLWEKIIQILRKDLKLSKQKTRSSRQRGKWERK